MSEYHPEIQLYCRKSSWYVYREKQPRYPDLSDEGYVLVEFIQCDMTLYVAFVQMGECVCEISWLDTCPIEEYLVSSHCYIPFKCCCKLLENKLDMITLYMDCDSLLLVRSYRVTWKWCTAR